uniref:hypothetical protein n=1 Tax=Altererythrobacter segetis TaxID=1104773 RepID=UPI00140962D9|nr:hypothetical protein [Altererythrobacter segetis]
MVRVTRSQRLRTAALLALPLLAACAAVPSAQPQRSPAPQQRPRSSAVPPSKPVPPPKPVFRAPEIQRLPGLESVIDKDAAALTREFGKPRLEVREGDMRKLQFAGEPCVLDVYLYPLRPGSEPIATHVDARRASDGLDVDRAACIAALLRR